MPWDIKNVSHMHAFMLKNFFYTSILFPSLVELWWSASKLHGLKLHGQLHIFPIHQTAL